MSKKLGRNDPCPCKSGKKFKKCHGAASHIDVKRGDFSPQMWGHHQTAMAHHAAREHQRQEQQGLGKGIVSARVREHRIVAVGDKIHASKSWKTFHDFLRDYPKIVLGSDWWLAEAKKVPADRHRILLWAVRAHEQLIALSDETGPLKGAPMTGAMVAFVRFAYDLYALQHSVAVQQLLIDRIKSPVHFPGAMYEVKVAAALLRAGFTLEMQDETDRRITHVEFVATHAASGAKYSVEAKRREGVRLKVNRLMQRALSKHSDHSRVVFIDVNDDRLRMSRDQAHPIALSEAMRLLSHYESDPLGRTLPEAYVVATYDPAEHHLDAINLPLGLLLAGFRMGDLKPRLSPLDEAVAVRRRHAPIFALIESMQKHSTIPVSFDGEADAFVFDEQAEQIGRLHKGSRHMIPGPDGAEIEATLESGIVFPPPDTASCVFVTDDGQRFLVRVPMTAQEVRAYEQHPQTFFGVIDSNAGRKRAKDAMDWFNFMWESYGNTSKEKLLEFLSGAQDFDELAAMTQQALATQYCLRMASSIVRTLPAQSQHTVADPTSPSS